MRRTTIIIIIIIIMAVMAVRTQAQEASTADTTAVAGRDSTAWNLTLDGVTVKGGRPVVRAEAGKLVYDINRMTAGKPVDNIYEALKELPGVEEQGESLTLNGRGVTIVVDGKVTAMDAEQLYTLLRGMPTERVADVEVMQNAPARYQVRGQLINVRLRHGVGDMWQGEAYAKYTHRHNDSHEERASMVMSSGRWSADAIYSYTDGSVYFVDDKTARHTLASGTVVPISNYGVTTINSNTHLLRTGVDYNIGKDHTLGLVYNGKYGDTDGRVSATGTQSTDAHSDGSNTLHNGRLDYRAPFGLKAGAEFTYYNTPVTMRLNSTLNGTANNFISRSGQHINRWRLYAGQEHKLGNKWTANYGVTYTNSLDNSYQIHLPAEGTQTEVPEPLRSRLREQTLNAYCGATWQPDGRWSAEASLAVEHYKNAVWDKWNVYPTLNVQYLPAEGHILQLGLSSEAIYPGYWETQNRRGYSGGSYSEIWGNPQLRPARTYSLSLNYVMRGKYVLSAWYNHTDDYFIQQQYQSAECLVEIVRFLNFNYQRQAGLAVSAPVAPCRWLSSRFTLMGIWMSERDDDFYDLPFRRSICYGLARMNNTVTFSPSLSLTVSGYVHSRAQQGIYDLPSAGSLDVNLRWQLLKKKATLRLWCNDIFQTSGISPEVNYGGQYSINHYPCWRELGVSLTWRIGDYKERRREEVDTSRFR